MSTRSRVAYLIAVGVILVAIALTVRVFSLPVITDDYTYFLKPWFNQLATHPGLSAFQQTFSDYPPLYLYLIKLLTFLPLPSLLSLKFLSILFDLGLGIMAYWLTGKKFLAGALVVALPTVMINSSLWGQSDSLYAFFALLSLGGMALAWPWLAIIAFAVGFSLKLQIIFILPLLIAYVWRQPRYRIGLLFIPLIYGLTLIPAWLSGGSFADLALIYLKQSGEYSALTLSAPTVFAFFNEAPISEFGRVVLGDIGIALALIVATVLAWLVVRSEEALSAKALVLMALLSAIFIPWFLPRMHERYFYLADVLSVVYIWFDRRRWYVPVAIVFCSLLSYLPYLSGALPWLKWLVIDLRPLALLMLLAGLSLLPAVLATFFPKITELEAV